MALVGKVVLLTGQAIVVDATGAQHSLALGDSIQSGDTIIAPKGTLVELQLANGSHVQIASQQTVTFTQELSDAILYDAIDPSNNAVTQQSIETVIQAINSGDNIDDIIKAFTTERQEVNGIIEREGHTFVDLLRINDVLNQFDYNYDVASGKFGNDNSLDEDRDVLQGAGLSDLVILPRIEEDLNRFDFTYKSGRDPFESRSGNDIDHRYDNEYVQPIPTPTTPSTPPFTVVVTPQGDGNKTAAEATNASGVMSVKSETGNTSVITFVGTNGTVVKTIINDGSNKTVVLAAADLLILGNGPVEVTTVTTSAITGAVITTPDIADGDFILDTIAPAAPIADLTHDAANDTGANQGDNLTKNASPAISGTGTPGDTITLYAPNGTTVLGTVVVGAGGTWSVDPAANYLVEGANALIVKATDPAGNQSPGTVVNVTLDTIAPAGVSGVLPTDATNDTGTSNTDNLTKNPTPTLTGTTEAGSTVTVTVNGVTYAAVVSGGTWSVSLTTPLPNGTFTPSIVATDAAGNITTVNGETFTVDIIPPAAAAISGVLPTNSTDDTGTSSTDNLTKNQAPTLTGTTEAGTTVTVVVNGVTYNAVVTGTTWTAPLTGANLPDGPYTPSITATDAAGNSTTVSGETFIVDATPTFAPIITAIPENSGGGVTLAEQADGTTIQVSVPANAQVGDVLTLNIDGQIVTHTVIAGDIGGTAAVLVPKSNLDALLNTGSHPVIATITDVAGNISPPSAPFNLVLTNVPLTSPIISDVPENAGGGINQAEASNGTDIVVDISVASSGAGAVAAGDTLRVTINGVNVDVVLSPANVLAGTVTVPFGAAQLPAADGAYNTTAVILANGSGLPGSTSPAFPITLDRTPPAAPLALDLVASSDTGISNTDDHTADNTPTITGAPVEPNATVTLYDSDGVTVLGTTVADALGNWSITTGVLVDGVHNFTIKQTDLAGNVSSASTPLPVTIDTAATLTLSATPSITEAGGTIVYTATVSQAPISALVVHLDNGSNITIAAGQTTGTTSITITPSDDVYIDPPTAVIATVTGTTGGGLVVSGTPSASTSIVDTIDVTTVTLTATNTVAEGGNITYTATLDHPNQASASPVIVTITGGLTISIAPGASTGTLSVAAPADDVYKEIGVTVSKSITLVSGGNFEQLTFNPAAQATTNVPDTTDTTTVSLVATASVAEGGSIVYTATLDHPNQASASNVIVTLSGGQTITIAPGAISGSISVPVHSDDVYVDAATVTNHITGVTGGNFEALTFNPAPAPTSVTDTIDVTTVSITGSASVVEGATANYTVSLTSPADTGAPVTVSITYTGTAANGADYTGVATVVIPAGASSANFNIATIDDVLAEGLENIVLTISGTSGGNFESLVVSGTNGAVTTNIIDNDGTPSLVVSDVIVNESAGFAVFSVSLSNASGTATSFNLALADGSANSGSDYTNALEISTDNGVTWVAASSATIPSGSTSAILVRTPILDGNVTESTENFTLTATRTAGTTSNASAFGTATIIDNDTPPVLDLNGTLVAGNDYTTTYTENGAGVPIGNNVSITDVEGSNILSATITLTNAQAGDVLAAGALPGGITASIVGNVVTLTGSATLAQYQTALQAITFASTSENPNTTPRNIDVLLNDGSSANSNVAHTTVNVTAINDPAVITGTSTANLTETNAVQSTGGSLTATDVDSSAAFVVQTGVAGSNGYGSFSINAAGVWTYTMNTAHNEFVGGTNYTDSITVATADGTTQIITVTIAGTNDGPVAISGGVTGLEDATSIPVTITGTDIDGTVASFNLSNLPSNGALYLDAAMTILVTTGTDIAASGNALTLYFKPATDFNSGAFSGSIVPSFSFTAKDNSGAVSASATETITVTPVNDGTPVAVNDAFKTLAGTPITFTGAQLLANDTLFDHAKITTHFNALPTGLTYNAGTDTYTYSPAVAGAGSFTYTITDDDGQTSTATVNLQAFNSRDDLGTVNESALAAGAGGGTTASVGALFTNDAGLSGNITAIVAGANTTFVSNTLAGNIRTIVTSYGTLIVDQTTGSYTYTLNNKVDNDSQTGATTNDFAETFTYTRTGGTANLVMTITDDAPTASNSIVQVPQTSALTNYNLVLMLDISGSMGTQVRLVDANGNVVITTRYAAAKQAMIDMVTKYFDESTSVSVKVGYFSTAGTAGTTLLTDKAAVIAAINAIPAAGGSTNYEDALYKIEDMFGPVDASKTNIAYFISDGVPTVQVGAGNGVLAPANETNAPTNPISYATFLANNPSVQSYAIGIGGGVSDPTQLNSIHNVDADASNVKDPAILVNDLNGLSAALTGTIPPTFGGTVGSSGSNAFVHIGADGGFVQFIDMLLDSNDVGTVPDTIVRFSYNPVTNQITYDPFFQTGVHGTVTVSGDILTLNAALGFTKGTLVFNFTTGDYSYYTQGAAVSGDQFDISYSIKDNDGDVANAVETVQIINGIPRAYNDFDTLLPKNTFFDGNVINAVSTDGAGQAVSVFTVGAGTDNAVDNAKVSSIVFNGATFNLNVIGSGTLGGGTYTVNAAKELTWTSSTDATNTLVFHNDGYYKYTPPAAQTAGPAQGAQQTVNFTTQAVVNVAGLTLLGASGAANLNTASAAAVDYTNATGVGVTGGGANTTVDSLETLIINFNSATYAQGVQNVSLNINAAGSNLQSGANTVAATVSVYDILGSLLGQLAISSEGLVALPTNWSDIGSIRIEPNQGAQILLDGVVFNPVLLNAAAVNIPDTVIGYTLTDAQGDTSSANLTLHSVTNEIQGTGAVDTITGTAGNDAIAGFAGNDTLNGGAGSDIIKGGDGDDSIDGGADDDQLYGGNGNDTIVGGAGNDIIYGDAGNDNLQGGIGNDTIYGGAGNDTIDGGAGNDIISGGAGTDILTGGTGSDIFMWQLADKGAKGAPATDTVTDFNVASAGAGGDVLDFRDLLLGENHVTGTGNLASYIHFEKIGADTIVHISSSGEYAAGFNAANDVQTITLTNVDLVTGFANDQQIIADLLTKQKLITD